MADMNFSEHTSRRFNKELEDIRNRVLEMGGMIEHQVANATKALLTGDTEIGEMVASSDYRVNALEVEIDEECSQILVRRQPAAGDLRLILTVIKTITDLERIGDEAEKIGRFAAQISNEQQRPHYYSELRHLSEHVKQTLHDTLDAFVRLDVEAALRIAANDKKINDEHDSLGRLLITHMMEDPRAIKSALRIAWCARSLERIGDHAQNICEYIIYLVKGKDIRHTNIDKIKDELFR